MGVVYATATKTARMTATKDQVLNGTLEIRSAALVVLATFTLSASAGSVSGDVWTLGFAASTVTAVADGVANNAIIKSSGGTTRISGLSIDTSGADINLTNTSIATGQSVSLVSATITHAT